MASVVVPSRFGVGRTEVNGRVIGLLCVVVQRDGVDEEVFYGVEPTVLGQLAAELDDIRVAVAAC